VKTIERRGEVPFSHGHRTPLDYEFHRVIGGAGFAYGRDIDHFCMDELCSFPDVGKEQSSESNGSSRQKSKQSWETTIHTILRERSGETEPVDQVLPYHDIPFHLAGRRQGPSGGSYVRNVLQTCHSRRFIVTDKGYIGVAPDEAREGDRITCWLALLFLLRSAISKKSPMNKE
jgi:hypothetical protein